MRGNRQAFIDRAQINYTDQTSRLTKIKSQLSFYGDKMMSGLMSSLLKNLKQWLKDQGFIMNRLDTFNGRETFWKFKNWEDF